MRKSVFRITGMSCASCAARIEKEIEKLAGVSSTVVNFAMEELIVSHDESIISEEDIARRVEKLGYGAIHSVLLKLEKTKNQSVSICN